MLCPICLDSLHETPKADSLPEPQPPNRVNTPSPNPTTGGSNVCATNCGHLFHRACLLKWSNEDQRNVTVRVQGQGQDFANIIDGLAVDFGFEPPNEDQAFSCPTCNQQMRTSQLNPIYLPEMEPLNADEIKAKLETLQNSSKEVSKKLDELLKLKEILENLEKKGQGSTSSLNDAQKAEEGDNGVRDDSDDTVEESNDINISSSACEPQTSQTAYESEVEVRPPPFKRIRLDVELSAPCGHTFPRDFLILVFKGDVELEDYCQCPICDAVHEKSSVKPNPLTAPMEVDMKYT